METLKIVKIGGNIIEDSKALDNFLRAFSTIQGPKLLVHGGGKLATKLAKQLGIDVRMINGRRITDTDTLDIITMVYAGKINKTIVAKLQAYQCNAVGFSGADGNSIVSNKRPTKPVDFGMVGDIKCVNMQTIELLLKGNIIPVFCAISHDENGQLLNTNADTIASELAIAFSKLYNTQLFYCFEKNGVLENVEDDNSVIELITSVTYKTLKAEGVIVDGMLPKLDNCFHALANDVEKIYIGKPEMLFNQNSKFTTIQNT